MSVKTLPTTTFPNSTFMSNASDCSSTETLFYTNFFNASYNATSTTVFKASSINFINTTSIDTSHTSVISSFRDTSISTRLAPFPNYTATTTQIVPIPTIVNITVTSVLLSTDFSSSIGYTTLTETLPCPLTNASLVSAYHTLPRTSSNYTTSCVNKASIETVTSRISTSSVSNTASSTTLSSSPSYTSHNLSTTHSNTSNPATYQILNNTHVTSENSTFVTTLAINQSSTIESILIYSLASSTTTSPLLVTTTSGVSPISSITKLSTVLTFQATNITLYIASTSYQNITALGNGYSGAGSTENERTSVRIAPSLTISAIVPAAIVSTTNQTPIPKVSSLDYSTSTSIRRSSITIGSTSTTNTIALSSTLPTAIHSGGGGTPFMPTLRKCNHGAPFALVVVFLAIAW